MWVVLLKILIIIAVLAFLSYPLLPLKRKAKKFSAFRSLRYDHPHNKKNIAFVFMTIVAFAAIAVGKSLIDQLVTWVCSIPFLGTLITGAIGGLSAQTDLGILTASAIVFNAVVIYGFSFLKGLVKKLIFDPMWGLGNKKTEKNKKEKDADSDDEDLTEANSSEVDPKQTDDKKRVPVFIHSSRRKEKNAEGNGIADAIGEIKKDIFDLDDEGKIPKKRPIAGLFFESPDYIYAKHWVTRIQKVLQKFIFVTEVLYFSLFLSMLLMVFFKMPTFLYTFFIDNLKIDEWYMYPFVSMIFLQEISNTLYGMPQGVDDNAETDGEKEVKKKIDADINALHYELKERFDREHYMRYYPETFSGNSGHFECTNPRFASSLAYVEKYMKLLSGRTVKSYMDCLDSICNGNHVYLGASFYSEFGEYLIAYTYTQLLAGYRALFIVSDRKQANNLRVYLNERLKKMTGTTDESTWRVFMSDERLDQADILVATPNDFCEKNIVTYYPGFFTEVSNAVFVDSDRIVSLDSYRCPIMARNLQRATDEKIRFVFLSWDILGGFSSGTLPKFFCVDSVANFSSAKDNEAVSYILWNMESKRQRIYNKDGQKLTGMECIIAEEAISHGIDGVRLVSTSPIEHSDRIMLTARNAEINEFHKDIPNVNYMIYTDDRSNLAVAMYACTRFRGKEKSVVNILSKPYLLREYFMSKAVSENYVNHSSIIQPRVTDHADRQKFGCLGIFCDANTENGISEDSFIARMRDLIYMTEKRQDTYPCPYCEKIAEEIKQNGYKTGLLAAYFVAALCDDRDTKVEKSAGIRAKDFYLLMDCIETDGSIKKHIVFKRAREVFSNILKCSQRVELRMNDRCIGWLDSFPSRVRLEYIVGQSIIYNNVEYEIEQISDDCKTIFLRNENVTFRNCLDTFFLRRYCVRSENQIGDIAVWDLSKANLKEIRVAYNRTDFTGETYGFYSLMSNRQTLDFYNGVEGTFAIDKDIVEKNARVFSDGRALRISFICRMECTDGMRLLVSAVFNEMIKTIFPAAYRCVAICPILSFPVNFADADQDSIEERIKGLYPYIMDAQGDQIETDSSRMQFILFNDSSEDVGVLDWFSTLSVRYMYEFIATIYSYLHWLQLHKDTEQYIFFGGDHLPECFDLDGCCELFKDFSLILSDVGKKDYETAGDDRDDDNTERCAFCHRLIKSGRYALFDRHRYICLDCFDVVNTEERLAEVEKTIRDYLKREYPNETFGQAKVELGGIFDLEADQVMSEYYYKISANERKITVETDDPVANVEVSILRGLIELWQSDNKLVISYSPAQLLYEEMKYLRAMGRTSVAEWLYGSLDDSTREYVDRISMTVDHSRMNPEAEETEQTDHLEADSSVISDAENSFIFMRNVASLLDHPIDEIDDSSTDEDYSDDLYNPNKTPRFWKRYLRNQKASDGEDELSSEEAREENPQDEADEPDEIDKTLDSVKEIGKENCPFCFVDGVNDEPDGSETGEGKPDEDNLNVEDPKDGESEEESDSNDSPEESEEENEPDTMLSTGLSRKEKRRQKKAEKRAKKSAGKARKKAKDGESERRGLFGFLWRKKKDPTKKDKPRAGLLKSRGERIVPYEKDEQTNPKIRLYNDIIRHAYNYSTDKIDRSDLNDNDIDMVFRYAVQDYPELFWISGYRYSQNEMYLAYRCATPEGKLDVRQIKEKQKAIRNGAKEFTRGITRRTNPYKALLTIYRRLILKLDYDGNGLEAGIDKNMSRDDALRSLYGALVEHKVVCAGYAVAAQYLLQSVGISCGYVSSETAKNGETHAFNALKLGRYCYFMDVTWGDSSNSKTGKENADFIQYTYLCNPYDEFIMASESQRPMHIPNKKLYPKLEKFTSVRHEYYRYHNAYLTRYDEESVSRIFAETAARYNEKTMGQFAVSFRCADEALAQFVLKRLLDARTMNKILTSARNSAKQVSKNAEKLLQREFVGARYSEGTSVLYFLFEEPKSKKEKNRS